MASVMASSDRSVVSGAPLVEKHQAVHALLEEQLWLTLEALVERDRARAAARFDDFVRLIERHMEFEEQRVLPCYEPLAPRDGPGRIDHVRGDHTIVQRHIAEGREHIRAVGVVGAGLRDVLARLPTFYRLLNVLEHHTMREQHVYSALEAVEGGDLTVDRNEIARHLDSLLSAPQA